MTRLRRVLSCAAIVATLAALTGAVAIAAGSRGKGKAKNTTGTVYFAFTHSAGGYNYADGDGKDSLLGPGAVTYRIKVLPSGTTGVVMVSAKSVTLWLKNGTLTGTASAEQNLTTGAVTNGRFSLKSGTAGQRGHSFVGTFSGSGSARSNTFHYTYQATYR